MIARKRTDTAQLKLRLPETLRRQIEREARKNDHSLNTEMVRRLEQSFARQEIESLIQTVATSSAEQAVDAALNRLNQSAGAVQSPGITKSSEGKP